MKNILACDHYNLFLALSTAICILVSTKLAAEHVNYARQLLKYFVKRGCELYGEEFAVYNVHGLLHIADDVIKFGCLDNCSAWRFENYMKQLKKKVRSGKNPAAQLVKRIYEETDRVPVVNSESLTIYCRRPNNAYVTKCSKYCSVVRVESYAHHTYLCRVYNAAQPIHDHPCDSRLLGFCRMPNHSYEMMILHYNDLKARCFLIEDDHHVTFMPLLHQH